MMISTYIDLHVTCYCICIWVYIYIYIYVWINMLVDRFGFIYLDLHANAKYYLDVHVNSEMHV